MRARRRWWMRWGSRAPAPTGWSPWASRGGSICVGSLGLLEWSGFFVGVGAAAVAVVLDWACAWSGGDARALRALRGVGVWVGLGFWGRAVAVEGVWGAEA